MGYKIIYSELFQEKLITTAEYIAENFSLKAVNDFLDETEMKTQRLIDQPYLGRPSSKTGGIRKIKVGKYNTVFYRVNEFQIEIVDLFDQRQDPDKSKY
jgi:plasmid stabilization system protein ParE